MIDGPPFEVEETGWGEFEIAIKFYFVPESTEKPQTVWHGLKLHPYGDDVDGQKERGETVFEDNRKRKWTRDKTGEAVPKPDVKRNLTDSDARLMKDTQREVSNRHIIRR